MKKIAEQIIEQQHRVLEKVLEGAAREGLALDAAMLEPGYRQAVRDLSALLCGALKAPQAPAGPGHDGQAAGDHMAEFAAAQARAHQERGIALKDFFTVFKLFRQGFCELQDGPDAAAPGHGIIARCFDAMEIAIISEWAGRERDAREHAVELNNMVAWLLTEIGRREQSEQRIHAALEEKNLLLREIHHRVKNNLQIISSLLELRALRSEDQRLVEALADARNKVHSIALIHALLYRSGEPASIDIGRILDEMIPYLYDLYEVNRNAVKLEIRADGLVLEIGQAIPCTLVINEILSNAFKHAFPADFMAGSDGAQARIRIFVRHTGNLVVIEVSDNGTGLPESMDALDTRTMGLKMINTLVSAQLKGRVTFTRDHGTHITISFRPLTDVD